MQFSRAHLYLDDNPSVTPQDTYTIDITATEAPLILGTDAVLALATLRAILTGVRRGNGKDEFVFGFEFDSNTVDVITDFSTQEDIDLTIFDLNGSDLDSSRNGIVDAGDTRVSLVGGNLEIDLSDFLGGTIEVQGVSSINLSAFVL